MSVKINTGVPTITLPDAPVIEEMHEIVVSVAKSETIVKGNMFVWGGEYRTDQIKQPLLVLPVGTTLHLLWFAPIKRTADPSVVSGWEIRKIETALLDRDARFG